MINNPFIWGDPYMYDLKWFVQTLHELEDEIKDVYDLQFLNYANPFQWSITRQYKKNTLTLDPSTGNVYLSLKPVPVNVDIEDTEYWTLVYNYEGVFSNIEENIGYQQGNDWVANRDYTIGDLVWINNTLYRVVADVVEGNTLRGMTTHETISSILKEMEVDNFSAIAENEYNIYANAVNIEGEELNLTSTNTSIYGDLSYGVEEDITPTKKGIKIKTLNGDDHYLLTDYTPNDVFKGMRVLCIGDSYNSAQGSTDGYGWGARFGQQTGAEVTIIHQNGGGVYNVATSNPSLASYPSMNFGNALVAFHGENPDADFDMVIVQGGYNDRGVTATGDIITNITNLVTTIRNYYPNAVIKAFTPWTAFGITTTNINNVNVISAYHRGWRNNGVAYCAYAPTWFYGRTDLMQEDNTHYTSYSNMARLLTAWLKGWNGKVVSGVTALAHPTGYVANSGDILMCRVGDKVCTHGVLQMSSYTLGSTLATITNAELKPTQNRYINGALVSASKTYPVQITISASTGNITVYGTIDTPTSLSNVFIQFDAEYPVFAPISIS